jgi:hypothetical protein
MGDNAELQRRLAILAAKELAAKLLQDYLAAEKAALELQLKTSNPEPTNAVSPDAGAETRKRRKKRALEGLEDLFSDGESTAKTAAASCQLLSDDVPTTVADESFTIAEEPSATPVALIIPPEPMQEEVAPETPAPTPETQSAPLPIAGDNSGFELQEDAPEPASSITIIGRTKKRYQPHPTRSGQFAPLVVAIQFDGLSSFVTHLHRVEHSKKQKVTAWDMQIIQPTTRHPLSRLVDDDRDIYDPASRLFITPDSVIITGVDLLLVNPEEHYQSITGSVVPAEVPQKERQFETYLEKTYRQEARKRVLQEGIIDALIEEIKRIGKPTVIYSASFASVINPEQRKKLAELKVQVHDFAVGRVNMKTGMLEDQKIIPAQKNMRDLMLVEEAARADVLRPKQYKIYQSQHYDLMSEVEEITTKLEEIAQVGMAGGAANNRLKAYGETLEKARKVYSESAEALTLSFTARRKQQKLEQYADMQAVAPLEQTDAYQKIAKLKSKAQELREKADAREKAATKGSFEFQVSQFMGAMFAKRVTFDQRKEAAEAINNALGRYEDEAAIAQYADDRERFTNQLTAKIKGHEQDQPDNLEDLLKAAREQTPALSKHNPLSTCKSVAELAQNIQQIEEQIKANKKVLEDLKYSVQPFIYQQKYPEYKKNIQNLKDEKVRIEKQIKQAEAVKQCPKEMQAIEELRSQADGFIAKAAKIANDVKAEHRLNLETARKRAAEAGEASLLFEKTSEWYNDLAKVLKQRANLSKLESEHKLKAAKLERVPAPPEEVQAQIDQLEQDRQQLVDAENKMGGLMGLLTRRKAEKRAAFGSQREEIQKNIENIKQNWADEWRTGEGKEAVAEAERLRDRLKELDERIGKLEETRAKHEERRQYIDERYAQMKEEFGKAEPKAADKSLAEKSHAKRVQKSRNAASVGGPHA